MGAIPLTAEYTQYLDRAALALRQIAPDDGRLDRALGLVDTVERTRHPDVWLVPSARADGSAYLVTHGTCSCRDAQDRGARCKHRLAVELVLQVERLQADAAAPIAITVEPADEAIPYTLGLRGRLAAAGYVPQREVPDLAPQCRRCAAEPRSPRHPDGLGMACIARELYGEEV